MADMGKDRAPVRVKLEAYGVKLEAEGDPADVERAMSVWFATVMGSLRLLASGEDPREVEKALRERMALARSGGVSQ